MLNLLDIHVNHFNLSNISIQGFCPRACGCKPSAGSAIRFEPIHVCIYGFFFYFCSYLVYHIVFEVDFYAFFLAALPYCFLVWNYFSPLCIMMPAVLYLITKFDPACFFLSIKYPSSTLILTSK